MSINAIETKDRQVSPFNAIAKGSIAGGMLGYAAKYMLPLSESEMDEEFKAAMTIIREQSNKAKAKTIETIRNIKDKTPAQDVFVKMLDADAAASGRVSSMRSVVRDAKLGKGDKIELEGLIACVNKSARDMHKSCVKGFSSVVKNRRVTPVYIAAGAVLGFFAGLGKSVFSSNV